MKSVVPGNVTSNNPFRPWYNYIFTNEASLLVFGCCPSGTKTILKQVSYDFVVINKSCSNINIEVFLVPQVFYILLWCFRAFSRVVVNNESLWRFWYFSRGLWTTGASDKADVLSWAVLASNALQYWLWCAELGETAGWSNVVALQFTNETDSWLVEAPAIDLAVTWLTTATSVKSLGFKLNKTNKSVNHFSNYVSWNYSPPINE